MQCHLIVGFGVCLEQSLRSIHRYHGGDFVERGTSGMGYQPTQGIASRQSRELRLDIPLQCQYPV
jgi:hypothetical protein